MNKSKLKWRFPLPRCRFNLKDIAIFQAYLALLTFWPIFLWGIISQSQEGSKLILASVLLVFSSVLTFGYTLVAL